MKRWIGIRLPRFTPRGSLSERAWRRYLHALVCGLSLGALSLSGCAAMRPIDGIPARYVPDEIKAPMRSGKKTIDLSLLSQTQPSVYHLDAGDVLAVYVEGVIPRPNEMPPINLPFNGEEAAPALGYPIPVRQDGTISLPLLHRALPVRGLTVKQAEDAVRHAYTVDKKILQSGNERVWVILHRPRQYRVLVIRQEGSEAAATAGLPGAVNLGALKRGTGKVVTLTAYKNDVLHALAETGGLPGLDAENTIYVIRAKRRAGGTTAAESWNPSGLPQAGWSIAPTVPPMPTSPLPTNDDPPRTVPGTAPLPATAVPPAVPNGESAPPPEIPLPPSPTEATPGPQSRRLPTSANSGLQLASLSFESADAPQQVRPAALESGVPPRVGSTAPPMTQWPPPSPPMMSHNAMAVPAAAPTLVPMNPAAMPWSVGLPPTDATAQWPEMSAERWMGHAAFGDPTLANHGVTKIPVRLAPGEQAHFTERDIILEDGDIVFIESRDTEIFYTGGLLGGGQYTLPRDYDLDVLGAIAIAQAGRATSGPTRATGGITALNNDVTISASQAVILRRAPNGTQVPIKVDLYRALRHPEERVLMQPGDYLLLQYTPLEACGAFFERHLLEGALLGVAASQFNSNR